MKNKILLLSLLLVVFANCRVLLASDILTTVPWPKELECKTCVLVEAYGYQLTLKEPISKVVMLEGLGLEVTSKTNSKKFSFGTPHESILPSLKEKLKSVDINISNWADYHELLSTKSSNKTIESLRKGLDVTKALNYYKYKSKNVISTSIGKLSGKIPTPFTAFYVEHKSPMLSSIIIIPDNSKVKPNSFGGLNVLDVILIKGKFIKTDVELLLGNL